MCIRDRNRSALTGLATLSKLESDPATIARMENEAVETVAVDPEIEEELLVEEISIDGMCGVY